MLFNVRIFGTRSGRKKQVKHQSKRYLDNKEKARKLVHSRLEYFNHHYGFKWNRVAIRNTKRRWGSCSTKGNLNFCYKIVLLPPELADYIIIHELCHLGSFDHSKRFWGLVERCCRDYKTKRKLLSKDYVLTD